MKNVIVKKESLEIFEEYVVTLKQEVYDVVNEVAKSIDKVNGGDYFDHLLVDLGMLTAMREVWEGVRESFTLTLTETSVTVS